QHGGGGWKAFRLNSPTNRRPPGIEVTYVEVPLTVYTRPGGSSPATAPDSVALPVNRTTSPRVTQFDCAVPVESWQLRLPGETLTVKLDAQNTEEKGPGEVGETEPQNVSVVVVLS